MSAEIGGRIHRLRTGKGLSQRELAEPRYTAAFISSVEAGRRTPSAEALEHLASRLGVSAGELRTGRAADVDTQVDLTLAEADREWDGRTEYERILTLAEMTNAQRAHAHIGFGSAVLREADGLEEAAAGNGAGQAATLGGAVGSENPAAGAEVPRPVDRAGLLTEAGRHFDHAESLLAAALPHERAEATVARAEILRAQGDPRYAVYLLTEVRDELSRSGHPDPSALLLVHAQLAVCLTELGDGPEAAACAEAALSLAGRADPGHVADLHIATARTLLAAGRLSEATAALAQARQARREAALKPRLAWCHRARGRERGRTGDLTSAAADLVVAHRLFREAGRRGPEVDTALELAELLLTLGRRRQAGELLAAHADVGTGRAERLRALMAGTPEEAERHFHAAIAAYRPAGPRAELAKVVGELADLLEARGLRDDAAAVMRSGLADVQRLTERAG